MDVTQISNEELEEYVAKEAQEHIYSAGELMDGYEDYLSRGEDERYFKLPWESFKQYDFMYGDFFCWFGRPGCYKSTMTTQMALWLSKDNPVCLANLEENIFRVLERMFVMVARRDIDDVRKDDQFKNWFCDFTKDKLYFYQSEDVDMVRLIILIKYCAVKFGIKHIIIDPLVQAGFSAESIDQQKAFAYKLRRTSLDYEICTHIVHHCRKTENKVPELDDLKYAGEIAGALDHAFVVHKAPFDGGMLTEVYCRKMRGNEKPEHPFIFYVDQDSLQFKDGGQFSKSYVFVEGV